MANTSEYRNVISNIDSTLAENSTEAISTEVINTEAISEGIANLLTDTNILEKINACCDDLLMGKSPMQHNPVYGSELRSHLNCSCYSPLIVNVQVLTRHGDFPLKGVKVSIYENLVDMCPIEQAGSRTDENGKISTYMSSKERCTVKSFTVEAIYENVAEKLRKEIARLDVTDVAKESNPGRKVKAENIIPLIQDISDTKDDKDYYERVDFPDAEGKYPSGTEPKEEEVKAGTVPKKGFIGGSKVSTFTYDPFANCFNVTMYMATFSLQVEYLSQMNPNIESFYIISGEDEKTLEAKVYTGPIQLDSAKHDTWTKSDSSFADDPKYAEQKNLIYQIWYATGENLCCPTSITMLTNYLGSSATRSEFMALCLNRDIGTTPSKFTEFKHSWQKFQSINAALNDKSLLGGTCTVQPGTEDVKTIGASLLSGIPVVQSITAKHIFLVIGAICNRNGDIVRIIVNDPRGTLSGEKSLISGNNWYKATKSDNKINKNNIYGKHVYYKHVIAGKNSTHYTRARSANLELRPGSGIIVKKRTPFAKNEIAVRLTVGI